MIDDIEYRMLLDIYVAADDYILGSKLKEFADAFGGLESLKQELECAVNAYTIEYNTMDEDE